MKTRKILLAFFVLGIALLISSCAPVHVHSYTNVAAKSATCTEDGNIAYKHCNLCGKNFDLKDNEIDDVSISASHELTHITATDATCTENGNIAYEYCSVCGKSFDDDGNELSNVEVLAGHKLTDVAAVDKTCTTAGNVAYKHCSVCNKNFDANGNELSSVEVLAGHTLTNVAAVDKTCTTAGNIAHKHCSVCNKNFDANGNELSNVVVPASHSYKVDAVTHEFDCNCGSVDKTKTLHQWTKGTVTGSNRVDTCICGATLNVSVWDGSSTSTSLSGNGTLASPYLISSAADLVYFANQVTAGTNYSGKYISLTKSIDLNNKHLMIGTKTNTFAGTFDGNNNYILNMNIVNTADGGTGLFVGLSNDALIQNVVTTGKVTGKQYTGSIAGYLNVGHLENCINLASVTSTSSNHTGGIAGGLNATSSLDNCVNYGSVTGSSATNYVGGITPITWSKTCVINNCVNYGTVTGHNARVGGIIGETTGTVSGCINYGTVSGGVERTGGIVGEAKGNIEDSYNYGVVTGTSYVGGILGTSTTVTVSGCCNYGSVTSFSKYAGGILGCVTTAKTTTIKNCENYGDVNTASYAGCIAGGVIADTSGLHIINCENDSPRISVIGSSLGDIVVQNMTNVPLVEDDEVITVLMLSNSYGDDTRAWVHEIAASYGVKINVANLYIGGCVLDTHLANLKADAAAYQLRYYENGTWNNQAATKISDALGYRDWDYVMLQQGSSQSGVAEKYSALDEIMDRILAIKSDVKFFWNMTWAYQQDSGHDSFENYSNDQMTMYNGILNAVQTKILTNDRIEFVVPNGTAIQNARTSYIGDTLCRDKSCHLNYEFGRYIAALTFFSKVTGIDISNVKFTTNISESDKIVAIESVKNALANPYKVTNSNYPNEIVYVYLIAGQSNAVGYGLDTDKVITNSDSRFTNGFSDVLYYGAQERWSGFDLSSSFQPVKIGMGVTGERCGAELGIANAISSNGAMNAIIKCAWGSTHIYPDTASTASQNYGTWTPPSYISKYNINLTSSPMVGEMYRWFIETLQQGLNLLKQKGYSPYIKGMWWMQGEAEMGNATKSAAYEELLRTLISDVRNDVSDITGSDYSRLPFVFGLPSWNTASGTAPTYQDRVRNSMMTVANDPTLLNVSCVDTKGLTQHDSWHFDAAGQKYLGENFIKELKKLNE